MNISIVNESVTYHYIERLSKLKAGVKVEVCVFISSFIILITSVRIVRYVYTKMSKHLLGLNNIYSLGSYSLISIPLSTLWFCWTALIPWATFQPYFSWSSKYDRTIEPCYVWNIYHDCWCSTVHGVDYICLLEAAYNQLITAMNRAIPVAIAVYRCVQVTSWNQLINTYHHYHQIPPCLLQHNVPLPSQKERYLTRIERMGDCHFLKLANLVFV